MIDIAGATDVLGRRGEPSEKVDWQSICESAPEIIVLMPCGFDVPRTLRETGVLVGLEGWHDLPGVVKAGKVFAVNGHAFFSRPGPRLVDGLEILAHIIHPKIFSTPPPLDVFGKESPDPLHRGNNRRRLSDFFITP